MQKGLARKSALVGIIIALVAAFKIFNLEQYVSLAYIKSSQHTFELLYHEHPIAVIVSYMAVYIAVTALSLPGAAVMTLAGGALFGLAAGTVIVSFASSIGATLACAVARFLLQGWVQRKTGARLARFNEGVEREGAFYLFTLRLIPLFPFWMINLAMGLTTMPLRTFYWVSQVGMLPGTIVYINAGKELGKIESPAGIMSPSLIASFVLLGFFPLCAKKLMGWYRVRTGRVLKP